MKSKQIIQKVKNRVVNFSIYLFPYQQNYRPSGYYSSITGVGGLVNKEGAAYINIVPAYPCDLDLQDHFYQLCNKEIRPQPAPLIPDSFIVSIPNGRIQQNYLGHCTSVISGDNKLIEEISFQTTNTIMGAPAAEMDIFKQKLFLKPVQYKGTVFSMLAGAACSTNIFHWLYDAVPRIFLLKESGLFDEVDYFLMPSLDKKYHKEVLQFLGLEGKKIIECKKYFHLQADHLIVSSHIRHRNIVPQWVCDHYRNLIIRKKATETPSELIYIERGDSNTRQVLNEDALKALLASYGFKSVLLSKLSYIEQAKLFASAKIIVSVHGAGLAHLSFCKEGTHMLELFSENYIKPTYQIISRRRKLNYTYIICRSETQPKTLLEANESHITVNLKKVKKNLKQIMFSNASAEVNLTF